MRNGIRSLNPVCSSSPFWVALTHLLANINHCTQVTLIFLVLFWSRLNLSTVYFLWKFLFQIISLDLWLILNIWKLFPVCNPNFFGFGLWSLRDVALCTKLLFFPPVFIKPAAFIKPPGFMHVAHTWFSDHSSLFSFRWNFPASSTPCLSPSHNLLPSPAS